MIWQLMKRDQTWQWTPLAAIFAAIYTLNQVTSDTLIILTLGMIGWTAPAFKSYCTLYEGALPISTRDLWLSRVMSLLAGMWLPVAIACTIRLVTRVSSVVLVETAAVYTVFVLGAKSVRLGQFAPPEWLNAIGIVIFAMTGAFLGALTPHMPPTPLVIAACGVASAALFHKGWSSLPKSFQIAPANAAARTHAEKPRARFVWAPVIRSFYGLPGLLLLSLMFTQMTLGSFLFWFVMLIVVQTQARMRIRWLLYLPISTGSLFAIMTIPPAAAILGGSILNIYFDSEHPLPASTRIVSMALQIAILYLFFGVMEMFRWRRLSKFAPLVRGLPAVIACTALAVAMALSARHGTSVLDGWCGWIAAAFSGHWIALGATLAAALVVAYCAAQKVFSELEYPNMRVTEWGK